MYLIFILFLAQSSENPWNFLSDKSNKGATILAYFFQPHLKLKGGDFWKVPKDGAGCQGNQPDDWEFGQFGPTPSPLGRGNGLEVESTNSRCFNQLCLHNEASIKTQKGGVWRASSLGNQNNTSMGTVLASRLPRSRSSCLGGLTPCISSSGRWLISFHALCNKPII